MDKQSFSEDLERRAYLLGMQLKQSGLDQEMIYVRLENDGIPEELAMVVAKELSQEVKREATKQSEETFNVALVIIGLAILLAIISYVLIPGRIILPVGIIVGGIVSAVISKRK